MASSQAVRVGRAGATPPRSADPADPVTRPVRVRTRPARRSSDHDAPTITLRTTIAPTPAPSPHRPLPDADAGRGTDGEGRVHPAPHRPQHPPRDERRHGGHHRQRPGAGPQRGGGHRGHGGGPARAGRPRVAAHRRRRRGGQQLHRPHGRDRAPLPGDRRGDGAQPGQEGRRAQPRLARDGARRRPRADDGRRHRAAAGHGGGDGRRAARQRRARRGLRPVLGDAGPRPGLAAAAPRVHPLRRPARPAPLEGLGRERRRRHVPERRPRGRGRRP